MIDRRTFVVGAAAAGSACAAAPRKTVLLCSGWQAVNIGDIAHTPGMLAVLERECPDLDVILWPKSALDRGALPMLRKRFPKVRLVRESIVKQGTPRPDDPTLAAAFKEAAFLLHGSGPSLVGKGNVERWRKETGKPWGVGGTTLDPAGAPGLRELLDTAAFVFTRETKSLAELRRVGCKCPLMDFAPDATFACDLRDDAAAAKLLAEHRLEPGKYLCAIPRLRYTPYWETHPERKQAPEEIARRKAVNAEHAAADHAKLRAGIAAWVRKTGGRVLLCPEMTYQVALLKPLLFDGLPDDVKPRVATMDRYWLTDEAASVYRQARLLLGSECHSPILALAEGVPAMYVRQPTDTWKGQMYPDLGAGAWAPEIDKVTGADVAKTVLAIEADFPAALALAKRVREAAAGRLSALATAVRQVAGVA